jgi:cobyrinic acid a,c-diamide synthase
MLDAPVILVIDARSITRSTAALVKGYQSFDPRVNIKGIILNKIGSAAHARKAKEAIEHYTGVEVIGQIPRSDSIHLTMRHLGLVPAFEGRKHDDQFKRQLDIIESVIRANVEVDKLIAIAKGADPLAPVQPALFVSPRDATIQGEKRVRIGVAYDEAFNFYYHDLFDLFSLHNADVTFFSPVQDKEIPHVDGIYIGGGYPELFAAELSKNRSMRNALVATALEGMPAGLIPAHSTMANKRVIGYVVGTTIRNTIIGPRGTRFRGHEFHYSEITNLTDSLPFAFKLEKGKGVSHKCDGIQVHNTLASYSHLHPLSYPALVANFIESCTDFREQTTRNTLSLL